MGSAEDGTKLDVPDEFDFNFELVNFGQGVSVVSSCSDNSCSGFVYLRKINDLSEELYKIIEHFDIDGFLLTSYVVKNFKDAQGLARGSSR